MNTSLRTVLISSFCTLLSFSALSFQSPQPQAPADQDMERITVYGQKTLRELKKEIRKTTKAFFKDYNKLNKNNMYSVICKKERNSGSNFKSTNCEPRYVKSRRADIINSAVFGNNAGSVSGIQLNDAEGNPVGSTQAIAFSRITMLSNAAKVSSSQNKKFEEHMAKLMKNNPALYEKYKELMALQDEYDYKKANR